MKPVLVILNGERAGERLILEEGKRYIIGRDRAADITLPEKKISRRHAALQWEGNVKVEDLGSLNGTSVNGELITGLSDLAAGDRIQVGSYLLRLDIPEQSNTAGLTMDGTQQTDKKNRASFASLEDFEPIQPILSNDDDSGAMTGGRMIQGKLSEIALPDLLQMLSATKKDGQLILSDQKITRTINPFEADPAVAFIFMKDGQIENALYQNLVGQDAFFLILRKTQGYFALFPLDPRHEFETAIEMPLEALLLEGFRRMDEEKASKTKFRANDKFEVNPEEPLSSLTSHELQVFQGVWKHRIFSSVMEHSGLPPEQTEEIIKKLLRSGFIKKI